MDEFVLETEFFYSCIVYVVYLLVLYRIYLLLFCVLFSSALFMEKCHMLM